MDLVTAFLTLGGLFLAGLAADLIGRRTHLPRVTLLLGPTDIALGHSGERWRRRWHTAFSAIVLAGDVLNLGFVVDELDLVVELDDCHFLI